MNSLNSSDPVFRIGAVARRSGVPVSTLRVWESRYGAFRPQKTAGRHRLYSGEDIQRARLLRQLAGAGHSIRSIARLGVAPLSALLTMQPPPGGISEVVAGAEDVRPRVELSVVGAGLVARLETLRRESTAEGVAFQVLDEFANLVQCLKHAGELRGDGVLVHAPTLNAQNLPLLMDLAGRPGVRRLMVLYGFAPERLLESLRAQGVLVRREPITDRELAALIQASQPREDAGRPGPLLSPGRIPPRRFDDAALARVAALSSEVLCECPRHVSEILGMLASFEQYSRECFSRDDQDAQLHAHLSVVSGSARVLFEDALQRIAVHEGVILAPHADADADAELEPVIAGKR